MGFYRKHVFFCVNQRETGRKCCAAAGSAEMRKYAKMKIKELGLSGIGGIRINMSGCLGRCALGPTIVIYPEGVWYTYKDKNDIDEIIDKHLIHGQIVKRLLLDQEAIM